MSMIGEYARLTPAELDRAVRDPGLTQDQVQAAATALGALPGDTLVRDVSEAELVRADLYPDVAGEGEQWLKYVTHHYDALVPFVQAAARAGDTLVVWLD